jgi:hypothetical protein
VRERDGGLERIADHVGEKAVAPEPIAEVGRRRWLRVNEHDRSQRFGLRPEWMKARIGELLASHASTDRDAAEPERLHAVFELLGREIGNCSATEANARDVEWLAQNAASFRSDADHIRREIAADVGQFG